MTKAFYNTKVQCEYCGEISKKPLKCCDVELLDAGTEYDIEWLAPIVDNPEDFEEVDESCNGCGKCCGKRKKD